MELYKNLGGTSGVSAFEIADDSITIKFKKGGAYLYNYANPGVHAVEKMKTLAVRGEGLNSYINTNVRKDYACKLE